MRRREGLAALAALVSSAVAPALAQGRVRTVGYLSNGADASWLARALAEFGHVEGRNLRIVLRVRNERPIDELAAEIVAAKPDVLVAWGRINVGAFVRQTRAIPIVCGETADPVEAGFARSLRRPGGNVTGLSAGVPEMAPMLVGLLRAVRPRLRRIAAIVEGEGPTAQEGWGRVLGPVGAAAAGVRLQWEVVPVASLVALAKVLSGMDEQTSALYLMGAPKGVERPDFVAAVNERKLANLAAERSMVRMGALMHYSIAHADPRRSVARMVDKLLRGASPAEMPFELPDHTTFILNRATARAIGVELPAEILARATEIVG